MEQLNEQKPAMFVDRRGQADDEPQPQRERRQFQDSRESSSFEATELPEAVDQYKLRHRRRFITFEELHDVIVGLGYHK